VEAKEKQEAYYNKNKVEREFSVVRNPYFKNQRGQREHRFLGPHEIVKVENIKYYPLYLIDRLEEIELVWKEKTKDNVKKWMIEYRKLDFLTFLTHSY